MLASKFRRRLRTSCLGMGRIVWTFWEAKLPLLHPFAVRLSLNHLLGLIMQNLPHLHSSILGYCHKVSQQMPTLALRHYQPSDLWVWLAWYVLAGQDKSECRQSPRSSTSSPTPSRSKLCSVSRKDDCDEVRYSIWWSSRYPQNGMLRGRYFLHKSDS
jgi:hypothetical protein